LGFESLPRSLAKPAGNGYLSEGTPRLQHFVEVAADLARREQVLSSMRIEELAAGRSNDCGDSLVLEAEGPPERAFPFDSNRRLQTRINKASGNYR
jgi:hypothetical protein